MRPVIIALALLAATPALAQDAPGRYQLERAGDGFLRLDRQTGAVSHCTQQQNKWTCSAVTGGEAVAAPAKKDAVEDTSGLSVEERLSRVERRLAALDDQPKTSLPSDQEVDRALSIFGRFLNLFKDFARDMNEEEKAQGQQQ